MKQTINPSNGQVIQTYDELSESEINARLDAGEIAYQAWKKTSFEHRSTHLRKLAELLLDNKQNLAELMSLEMGKPIMESQSEIEKCAWVCQHYAEHAEEYLKERPVETEGKKSRVCYRPLGIVFAIMPWNFPFWQVFRFLAPALMAGNAAVLKHAEISIGCGEAIAELVARSGFPEHLFHHFILSNDDAAKVIAHPRVVAVTLTGSERAGRSVAATAGHHLKKTVLELGGSDAYLVLKDADIKSAADIIVKARLANCGQSCISPKRILVDNAIVEEFTQCVETLVDDYQTGLPQDSNTMIGPMAREDLRAELHRQIEASVAQGAKLLRGGKIPDGKGFFYPATLLSGIKPGMPAFDQELFGPVVAIGSFSELSDGIALANKSCYGLGAAVFTSDLAEGERIAREELEAGSCFVNNFVVSDPRLPFGGIKLSGYGRELSKEGILEFVNIKTVVSQA